MADRPMVRPMLGMKVYGEVGGGPIVAMSKEWCIYEVVSPRDGRISECAEPWESIVAAVETPTEAVSSVTEGPPVPKAED